MKILRHLYHTLLLAGFLMLAFPPCASAQPLVPVSLQLRWKHQFQFAGYYAALHKGYFKEAGLDVSLKEGGPGVDPVADVLSGACDFGVGESSLVVDYLKGKPVLMLGPVFQHSPNVLIAHGRNKRPDDLVGKRIAMMSGDQDMELKAIFLNEGIAFEKLRIVPDEKHLQDFLDHHVDALNAYLSNEPFVLDQRGIPYTIIKPHSYGMDFYGDVLFTRKAMESSRPEVVAAFLAASFRGWQYALDHQSEIIDLIFQRYNSQGKTREHLAYEARELHQLINPEVIEIGHNNPGRWHHIASTFQRFGITARGQTLDGFFYKQKQKTDLTRFYWALAVSTLFMLVSGSIALFIHRINRRLKLVLEEKSRSEERHRIIFETSPSAGVVWRDDFIITDWNRQAEVVFGWSREEVLGRSFTDFLLPEAEQPRLEHDLPQMLQMNMPLHIVNDNMRRDGRVITCEWFNSWLPERPGHPREVLSLATDITERKQSELALAEQEQLWRTIINTSPDGILIISLDGVINHVSEKLLSMTGFESADELIGRSMLEFVDPDWHAKAIERIGLMLQGTYTGAGEYRVIRKDGSHAWFEANAEVLRNLDGSPREIFIIERDITERKKTEHDLTELTRSLELLSITDSLTGLANRRHFDVVLETEFGRHVRSGGELSLIMLDIDHFKAFNDTYGHLKGDDCLREVGRVLRECTSRAVDLAARYGGEEFVCILPDTDRNGAVFLAEQIRRGIEALAIPHSKSSVADHVTASLGVVTTNCSMDSSPLSILSQADELLYQAKSSGRNRIEIDSSSISMESLEEISGNFVQLVWNDSFCSGNPLIDAQHQSLFQIANELFDSILSGCPPAEISPVIGRLLADVTQHFQDEQMILEKIAFPGLKKHLEEHDRLVARGVELSEQFEASALSVGALFQFLAYDVVKIHMLGADQEYFPYFIDTIHKFRTPHKNRFPEILSHYYDRP